MNIRRLLATAIAVSATLTLAAGTATGAIDSWTVRFSFVPQRVYQGQPAAISVLLNPAATKCSLLVAVRGRYDRDRSHGYEIRRRAHRVEMECRRRCAGRGRQGDGPLQLPPRSTSPRTFHGGRWDGAPFQTVHREHRVFATARPLRKRKLGQLRPSYSTTRPTPRTHRASASR